MVPTHKIFDNPKKLRDTLSIQGQKVVWTNGCFDLLHAGHLHSLREAAGLGDILIVGLNSDLSVKTLKGDDRPIFDQNYRAELLSSLDMVNAVLLFDGTKPLEALDVIRPDIYAKGGDYIVAELEEAKKVMSYGGKIVTLSFVDSLSTSDIIDKIKKL